jgi:hypothetical protein
MVDDDPDYNVVNSRNSSPQYMYNYSSIILCSSHDLLKRHYAYLHYGNKKQRLLFVVVVLRLE